MDSVLSVVRTNPSWCLSTLENWLRLFEQFPAKDKWTSAGLLSFSPMLGVTQGGRSPTVVMSNIGGGKFMPPPP